MQTIPLSDIVISEDRQRREFDSDYLVELANSIATRGLFHAPLVQGDGTLIAGECRYRAIKILNSKGQGFSYNTHPVPAGTCPVIYLGELTSLECEEAELEENIVRRDLTWQERANAVARLHALRCEQNFAQTASDTADEIYGGSAPKTAPNRKRKQ
jgi:ParB-like chromosome segregation protein Spo0J